MHYIGRELLSGAYFPMLRSCLGLAFVISSSMWAQSSGAILQVSGTVQLNGASVSRPAVLFDADKVRTSADSAASITQSGSSMLIGANSEISYSPQGLTLSTGSATITTSQHLGTHIGAAYVRPTSANSRFVVLQTPSKIQIAALEGDLAVRLASKKVVTLNAGNSLSLPLVNSALQEAQGSKEELEKRCELARKQHKADKDCDKDKDTTTRDAEPRVEAENFKGNIIAAVAGAGAAVATVVALVLSSSLKHISPSGP